MGRIGNIINRKGKQDAQRAKIFTKHARLIAVASKMGGGDPEYNATLKNAIEKAKNDNMPNDNIDRAIKKGLGAGESENYEHITYEGYGPGGVAVIVETLTDNKNRTAGNMRYYFDKNGGNLGTAGCVSFMFDRKGQIIIEQNEDISEDDLMETSLEAGAEDFIVEEDCYVVITDPENFMEVKESLLTSKYEFISSDIEMIPQTHSSLDADQEKSMLKLLDLLEDDDDVQNIYHNWQQ
ncbi:YebC/PmpR family DNA-binding regulatory protein [Acetoanaerobium pronyense]|uniref:Probable transcriptional regulatory protein J2Z35_001412 n=1 Tax=Acetoanaerobium pronyense TaxID=1482736 RepID=A0ABS4KJU1_9FIRM|nr:YebC/PmpR family DNA-binding regulatory protein [Acetoanaerobium pronyense]